MKKFFTKDVIQKLIALLILIALALVSSMIISKIASAPQTYARTIQSIDEKKATVMGLTATTAAASAAIATIPGDATTPIANQIMELSSYLLIVVCVLVLEKSLLTVLGFLSFGILVPLSCGLFAIFLFWHKELLKTLAIKFMVLAVVIISIIPLSLRISDLIYEVNKATIDEVTVAAEESATLGEESNENQTWFGAIVDKVKNGVSNVTEELKKITNRFIDAIAIFIITYCAIPIIVVLLVIWFVKFLFGIAIPGSNKLKVFPPKPKARPLIKHTEE